MCGLNEFRQLGKSPAEIRKEKTEAGLKKFPDVKTIYYNASLSTEEQETIVNSSKIMGCVQVETTEVSTFNTLLDRGWELLEVYRYKDTNGICGGVFQAPLGSITYKTIE